MFSSYKDNTYPVNIPEILIKVSEQLPNSHILVRRIETTFEAFVYSYNSHIVYTTKRFSSAKDYDVNVNLVVWLAPIRLQPTCDFKNKRCIVSIMDPNYFLLIRFIENFKNIPSEPEEIERDNEEINEIEYPTIERIPSPRSPPFRHQPSPRLRRYPFNMVSNIPFAEQEEETTKSKEDEFLEMIESHQNVLESDIQNDTEEEPKAGMDSTYETLKKIIEVSKEESEDKSIKITEKFEEEPKESKEELSSGC